MKERITTYLAWMEEMLENDEIDKEALMKRHLREIAFFQHERLIHLMVMALMVILAFMVFVATMLHFSFGLLAVFLGLMVLVVPYIRHYFLLENSVQTMYYQYDTLYEQVYKDAAVPQFINLPGYIKHKNKNPKARKGE